MHGLSVKRNWRASTQRIRRDRSLFPPPADHQRRALSYPAAASAACSRNRSRVTHPGGSSRNSKEEADVSGAGQTQPVFQSADHRMPALELAIISRTGKSSICPWRACMDHHACSPTPQAKQRSHRLGYRCRKRSCARARPVLGRSRSDRLSSTHFPGFADLRVWDHPDLSVDGVDNAARVRECIASSPQWRRTCPQCAGAGRHRDGDHTGACTRTRDRPSARWRPLPAARGFAIPMAPWCATQLPPCCPRVPKEMR